jgi:hypothetical protein
MNAAFPIIPSFGEPWLGKIKRLYFNTKPNAASSQPYLRYAWQPVDNFQSVCKLSAAAFKPTILSFLTEVR